MPEDIFEIPRSKGIEVPIEKSKRNIRRAPVRKRPSAVKKKIIPKKSHKAEVNAALHSIGLNNEQNFPEMEIGGHLSSFNPTPRFYRTIALSFLACTIILVGAVVIITMGKVAVIVKTKPQTVTFDAPIGIVANPSGATSVKGKVLSTEVSSSRPFSPESGLEQPSYAFGQVTLINNSNQNQVLVATTRLLSKENILFRLRKSVSVPFGGKIIAEVIADKPGKENEIKPTSFTIPGLSETKQKLIYAESNSAMVGGAVRRATLTEIDVERAKSALVADLLIQGKVLLARKINASSTEQFGSVFSTVVKELKNDSKVGVVTSQFTLSMKVEIVGVFYAVDSLNKYISNSIQNNTAFAGSTISPVGQAEVTLNRFDEKMQTADVRVKQEWMAKSDTYSNLIDKKQLVGLTAEDTARALKGLDWVDNVQVIFSPSWIKHIPKNTDKIKIEFSKQ